MVLKSWWMLLVVTLLALALSSAEADDCKEAPQVSYRKGKSKNNQPKKHPQKKNPQNKRGEKGWPKTCSGNQQSPVNIETNKVKNVKLPKLKMSGVNQRFIFVTINNEHGRSVQAKPKFQRPVTLTGGIIGKRVYSFRQFHFHWGASEHAIDRKKLPLEAHFVFCKKGKPTVKALNTPGDTVVLSVMYRVGKRKNKYLKPMMKALESRNLEKPDSAVKCNKHFRLRDYLPKHLATYYTYIGSLTTPPCTEKTRFIVFKENNVVTSQQLKDFRMIRQKNGKHVTKNWRQLAPLNGRRVIQVKST